MNMKKRPRIVVFGSMHYDYVMWAEKLPAVGETVIATKFATFIGGKGANQAVQASKLGAEVYMIGRIGNDFMGDEVMKSLEKNGVITEYVKRDSHFGTGTASVMVDNNGSNYLMVASRANTACTFEDINEALDLIKSADIFMTQIETNIPVTEYSLKIAYENNVKTIFNPAPARKISKEVFKYSHIVTPNETEAEIHTGIKQEKDIEKWCEDVASEFRNIGVKTLVITLGKNGAFLYDNNKSLIIPTYTHIKAVDTTAAGDAFNGAMAVGLAEGMTLEEAIKFANGAGTIAASREGAQASLASREELDCFMSTVA